MLVFLLNNELSLFPVMHLLFQWWLFMLNMGKVSNTEVSLCTSNPCELKARPYTALNTQRYTVCFLSLHLCDVREGIYPTAAPRGPNNYS